MRMRPGSIGFAAGIGAAALTFSILGTDPSGLPQAPKPAALQGAGEGGIITETIAYRGVKGQLLTSTLQRTVIKVPHEYGGFVAVTGGQGNTLWFADTEGNMRNVRVGDELVIIERDTERMKR